MRIQFSLDPSPHEGARSGARTGLHTQQRQSQVTLAMHELLLLHQTLCCQRYLEGLAAVGIQGRREDQDFFPKRSLPKSDKDGGYC